MGLPWVRLDANIASHDKMLDLLADPSAKRYQAAASYMFAIAWSGGQGTDGRVRTAHLGAVHGNASTARLLVKYGLWDEAPAGYQIRNWDKRQQSAEVASDVLKAKRDGAIKGNCIRHHGKACGCWKTSVEGVA